MPGKTILEIPEAEQAEMLKELRRHRYGYLLALHVLILCARGYNPTVIAEVLLCSRTSVYRIVEAYLKGTLDIFDAEGRISRPLRTTVLIPKIKESIVARLKKAPEVYGWCRTRWSCETLALELKAKSGIEVSAETMRRWLKEIGWVWKRAKLVARDADSARITKLAHIRLAWEQAGIRTAFFFADELDLHLLPKVGYEWTLKGTQTEVMTPGQNQKTYLAGALDFKTGQVHTHLSDHKNGELFLSLLTSLDAAYPVTDFDRIVIVVDNFKIHDSVKVNTWLETHPRFERLFLPTYCPRANPIERVFGDVHDQCTRNHKRSFLTQVVADVLDHFQVNGPWTYQLSKIYFTPEVDAEVERLAQLAA